MAALELQPSETVLARSKAQLAQGFPQTYGALYLTTERLVLVPNQFFSMGFGRRLEIPLSRIVALEKLSAFQGGTFIGSAGRKLVVGLDDSSEHTFSFSLTSDIDGFCDTLATRVKLPIIGDNFSEDISQD
jgi:hypothetical protein